MYNKIWFTRFTFIYEQKTATSIADIPVHILLSGIWLIKIIPFVLGMLP